MADPRRTLEQDGTNIRTQNFTADAVTVVYASGSTSGATAVGLAMALTTAGKVETAGDGEEVVGKLLRVEPDNVAVVQIGGVMTLPAGTGATLTYGAPVVGRLGTSGAEGYIGAAVATTAAEANIARGQIVAASDTANVRVQLP